ncbi:hypothetical protein QFC20_002621 [Naganishia adeliensis]|uniref:Uncharacterized protein n=1 Tax=Naganishia adeliensis TaxID=92952 RepID=A0ACC2WJG8_9TREE|nr:hypothetical protein QFC20_002621 [Naganishia adeliensis]
MRFSKQLSQPAASQASTSKQESEEYAEGSQAESTPPGYAYKREVSFKPEENGWRLYEKDQEGFLRVETETFVTMTQVMSAVKSLGEESA